MSFTASKKKRKKRKSDHLTQVTSPGAASDVQGSKEVSFPELSSQRFTSATSLNLSLNCQQLSYFTVYEGVRL